LTFKKAINKLLHIKRCRNLYFTHSERGTLHIGTTNTRYVRMYLPY